ncbi:MAG: C39 family peptidase [Erysipelotrichaceae bacterium]
MKKFIKYLVIVGVLTIVSNSMNSVKAATEIENESTSTEDGTPIVYDDSIMNGSVNLEENLTLNESELVDKSRIVKPRSTSVIITIPFQTQQNDYYCGPASAKMVLGGIGYTRTQDQMASLLGTNANDGTYAGEGVANALNSVVAGSKYQFRWQWHNYLNVSTIKGHIVEALDYGNPVMVNTVESPGDVYLAGHDIGVPLYHYGVVADYFESGNSVTYTDPGYGRYSGFMMDQRATITNLSYAVGGRGYAW